MKQNNEERIKDAEKAFGEYLTALGFDWQNDPHMQDTPLRVAKSHINELFAGSFMEEPKLTVFSDTGGFEDMVFVGDIVVNSMCSHHFLPFIGKAHLAYIPNGKVLGLSKLNRIVNYFSRRPQLQERLMTDITNFLMELLDIKDVALSIESQHFCTCIRGVNQNSTTITTRVVGAFRENPAVKEEFLHNIQRLKK